MDCGGGWGGVGAREGARFGVWGGGQTGCAQRAVRLPQQKQHPHSSMRSQAAGPPLLSPKQNLG